jgi:hypothetical protein
MTEKEESLLGQLDVLKAQMTDLYENPGIL